MSQLASGNEHDGGNEGGNHERGDGVYHVNDRAGRVDSRGEELTGATILERTELSAEKYELWTIVDNKAGVEIKPTDTHHVKPGDRYRATIRGTDYSCWGVDCDPETAR
jgi:hypothetical protein